MNRRSSFSRLALVAGVALSLAALTGGCSSAPPSEPSGSTESAMKCRPGACDGDNGGGGGNQDPACAWDPPPGDLAAAGCGLGDGRGWPCPPSVVNFPPTWLGCQTSCSKFDPGCVPQAPVVYISTNADDGCINSKLRGTVVWGYCKGNDSPSGCTGPCGSPF